MSTVTFRRLTTRYKPEGNGTIGRAAGPSRAAHWPGRDRMASADSKAARSPAARSSPRDRLHAQRPPRLFPAAWAVFVFPREWWRLDI